MAVSVLSDVRIAGQRFMGGTVTLDGSNPTPIDLSTYMSSVLTGVATIQGTTATGADPNQVSVVVNGSTLDVYAWKVTTGGASGNPTEVASTDSARTIHWFAIGIDLPRKGS